MVPLLEPDNKTNRVAWNMSVSEDANTKHAGLYAQTQSIMNRLLSNQVHYESVRLLRNIDWSFLFLIASTVRTRLELTMSFDPFLEPILERVNKLSDSIAKASDQDWQAMYNQKELGELVVNILFTPAASQNNSLYRVTYREPERINVQEVFDMTVNGQHDSVSKVF
jgi:hypothetical protein